ncbi:MAG TPA: type II toxin-antitoxin system RelE/ParE family toxin [Ginsengibacter sp.]
MKYLVEKKFLKDLQPLPKEVKNAVAIFFVHIEEINSFDEIHNVEKLTGFKEYYRYRIGHYRCGFAFRDGKIIFLRILHRSEIYKSFP